MSQLTTEEKLGLVVRAQVAQIRAAEATQRASVLQRRMNALLRTLDRFHRLHDREADLHDAMDRDAVQRLCRSRDPEATSPEIGRLAGEALEQATEAREAAREALLAIKTKLSAGSGETVVDWVGVSRETIEQRLIRALAEESSESNSGGGVAFGAASG